MLPEDHHLTDSADEVLGKAEAFLRRRRPVTITNQDEDLPVLTDIVTDSDLDAGLGHPEPPGVAGVAAPAVVSAAPEAPTRARETPVAPTPGHLALAAEALPLPEFSGHSGPVEVEDSFFPDHLGEEHVESLDEVPERGVESPDTAIASAEPALVVPAPPPSAQEAHDEPPAEAPFVDPEQLEAIIAERVALALAGQRQTTMMLLEEWLNFDLPTIITQELNSASERIVRRSLQDVHTLLQATDVRKK